MSTRSAPLILNGTGAIDDLLRALPLVLPGPPGPIAVEAAHLSDADSRAAQERINRLYDACGCDVGAAGAIASVAAYVVYCATAGAAVGFGLLGTTVLGVVVFLVGGALGKTIGILSARRRLVRELRDLRRRLP
jgi:hypothetical protein